MENIKKLSNKANIKINEFLKIFVPLVLFLLILLVISSYLRALIYYEGTFLWWKIYNGKKYNTLLRFVLIIISNKIKVNGEYINKLYSSATNPISAHLLMKNFDSTPRMDETNDEFIYFMDNIYKGDKENINNVVSKFYETNAQNVLPILFDIILTDELIGKSLENFKMIIGEINPDNLDKQIKCP